MTSPAFAAFVTSGPHVGSPGGPCKFCKARATQIILLRRGLFRRRFTDHIVVCPKHIGRGIEYVKGRIK